MTEIDDIDTALARLQALDTAATQGEWMLIESGTEEPEMWTAIEADGRRIAETSFEDDEPGPTAVDLMLIAELRNDGLPLLRRLRAEVEAARRVETRLIDYLQGTFDSCPNSSGSIAVVLDVAEIMGFEIECREIEPAKERK